MIDWDKVDTVLLDMDGTLLDLHFDNYFWLEHLPLRYAQENAIAIEQAKSTLHNYFNQVQGKLQWYCLDYWTQKIQLDIRALKREVEHKIAWKTSAKPFLNALKERGMSRILLTNDHPDSLARKIHHTQLDQHLDHIYSTHDFGYCKESPQLWKALLEHHSFDPNRTLFIDDNETLLMAAKQIGIAYQLGFSQPDSTLEASTFDKFPAIQSYETITKQLVNELSNV